jgi:CelD/BcsL family acetyltransferase involved in cellulose biosynthesis
MSIIARVLDAELIDDVARLRELSPEWERLAVSNKSPLSSPAWMLAWLDHLAPASAKARVVAVREEGELVGLAPFFVAEESRGRVDYRLMGNALPRATPLASPNRKLEVATVIARKLAAASPRPDVVALECSGPASGWGSGMRKGWPGRIAPPMAAYLTMSAPVVSLEQESFDAWLNSKSSNFRSQMRRTRRQFAEQGGVSRTTTTQTLEQDVDLFIRLHAGRWEGRGSSSIVAEGEGFGAMLADIGAAHIDSERFRLWILEVEGTPISAQLFARAGGEVVYYNGGWDERFAKLKPAMLGILDAIEDAFTHGDKRLDLGPGGQSYKWRFADSDDPLAWTILMTPGPRLPLTLVRSTRMLAVEPLRGAAKRRLSAANLERLRRAKRTLKFHGH